MRTLPDTPAAEAALDETAKCIECGTCLHSCPVYRECLEEENGPRGRNRILRDLVAGGLTMDDAGFAALVGKCLLCGRCVSGCPRGVRNDLTIIAARAALVARKGLPLVKTVAFRKLMADRPAMDRALRLARFFQKLLPRTQASANLPQRPPLRHLPVHFMGLGKDFQLPDIADRFLEELIAETTPPAGKPRGLRVAFFSGCATRYVLPQVGRSMVELLAASGVEVVHPAGQSCCGVAVLANGDAQTARAMALANLEALTRAGADLIVTGCATCGSTLKEGWVNLFRDDPRQADFAALAGKVRDFSQMLIQLSDFKPLELVSALPAGTRVTYHDPCHLARFQGITWEPRRILRQAFGENFVDMGDTGCCGCGGSFSVHNPDLSRRIGEEKIAAITRTKADVVVNTCPGCMIQLVNGLARHGMPQRVLHLADAVRRA